VRHLVNPEATFATSNSSMCLTAHEAGSALHVKKDGEKEGKKDVNERKKMELRGKTKRKEDRKRQDHIGPLLLTSIPILPSLP